MLTTRPTIKNRAHTWACGAGSAFEYRETNPYCETPRSGAGIVACDSLNKGGSVEATFTFVSCAAAGGFQLYIVARNLDWHWPWHIFAVVVIALLLRAGIYPPFFPRGSGMITPNRVIGGLLYLAAFNGSIFFATYSRLRTYYLESATELIALQRKYVWKDHHE